MRLSFQLFFSVACVIAGFLSVFLGYAIIGILISPFSILPAVLGIVGVLLSPYFKISRSVRKVLYVVGSLSLVVFVYFTVALLPLMMMGWS